MVQGIGWSPIGLFEEIGQELVSCRFEHLIQFLLLQWIVSFTHKLQYEECHMNTPQNVTLSLLQAKGAILHVCKH